VCVFFSLLLFDDKQLCITLNNISHVRGYLGELSNLLNWDIVAQQLSIKHEDEAVGQMALRSLTNLVAVTDEDVTAQSRILAQQVIEKIAVDLKKYTAEFAKCCNDQPNVRVLINWCLRFVVTTCSRHDNDSSRSGHEFELTCGVYFSLACSCIGDSLIGQSRRF
jgi:hypothetical protein